MSYRDLRLGPRLSMYSGVAGLGKTKRIQADALHSCLRLACYAVGVHSCLFLSALPHSTPRFVWLAHDFSHFRSASVSNLLRATTPLCGRSVPAHWSESLILLFGSLKFSEVSLFIRVLSVASDLSAARTECASVLERKYATAKVCPFGFLSCSACAKARAFFYISLFRFADDFLAAEYADALRLSSFTLCPHRS